MRTLSNLQPFLELYSELNFAVLPAVYGEKRPSVEWKQYQEKGPSKKEIQDWFNGNAEQNIAILCGAPSANLVVLDFDEANFHQTFGAGKDAKSRPISPEVL